MSEVVCAVSEITPEAFELDHSRQSLMINGADEIPVVVIGAGGIGSNVVFNLASTGYTDITVFDHDTVGVENIAPAFLSRQHLKWAKVNGLKDLIYDILGVTIKVIPERYTGQIVDARVVINTVDGKPNRREVWEKGKSNIKNWELWLDPRMGSDTSSVVCLLNPMAALANQVAAGLFTEEEALAYLPEESRFYKMIEDHFYNRYMVGDAAEIPCGEKATAFITKGIIPGMVGNVLFNWLAGRDIPFEIIDIATPYSRLVITYETLIEQLEEQLKGAENG